MSPSMAMLYCMYVCKNREKNDYQQQQQQSQKPIVSNIRLHTIPCHLIIHHNHTFTPPPPPPAPAPAHAHRP